MKCCSILQTGHITLSSTPDELLENQSTKYHRQQPLYNTLELLMMGMVVPKTCWASNRICNKKPLLHLVGILFPKMWLCYIRCIHVWIHVEQYDKQHAACRGVSKGRFFRREQYRAAPATRGSWTLCSGYWFKYVSCFLKCIQHNLNFVDIFVRYPAFCGFYNLFKYCSELDWYND